MNLGTFSFTSFEEESLLETQRSTWESILTPGSYYQNYIAEFNENEEHKEGKIVFNK